MPLEWMKHVISVDDHNYIWTFSIDTRETASCTPPKYKSDIQYNKMLNYPLNRQLIVYKEVSKLIERKPISRGEKEYYKIKMNYTFNNFIMAFR